MLGRGIIERLEAIAGKRDVLSEYEDLLCYRYDSTYLTGAIPAVVVYPESAAEVSEILALANERRIPVFPRGSATGSSGASIPAVQDGIVLCTKRMNRIIEIDAKNLTATVEPGVVLGDLQREVEKVGLYYPPDPSSLNICTLGGNVALNAGGPHGVKYGATNAYIIGLEVVLADGRIIKTGSRCVKQASGYKLTHLFVGSEGTLGVITRIIVRLVPKPEARKTMLCVYDRLGDAATSVQEIIGHGIVPCTIELMDRKLMQAIEQFVPCGLPVDAEASLIIECDGDPDSVDRQIERISEICRNLGARETRVAATVEEAETIWAGRRAAYPVMSRLRPTCVVEDVTVPRTRLVEMIEGVKAAGERWGVQILVLAHAGDGNMHPHLLCDARDAEEMSRIQKAFDDIMREALALGGTASGEHGIGLMKRAWTRREFGDTGIEVMQAIKRTLDPNGILNPGKLWEEESR